MLNIFLSSTFRDQVELRRAVIEVLDRRYHVVAMEKLFAGSQPPLEVCLSELDGADVVVLLLASKYGSLVENGIMSYTEAEYERALKRNIPVLVFIKGDAKGRWANRETTKERKEMLRRFKARLENERYVRRFHWSADLQVEVLGALGDIQQDQGALDRLGLTFQRTDSFFGPFLNENNRFNHTRRLLGRDDTLAELKESIGEDRCCIVLLGGAGGTGKSRVLLELARSLEAEGVAVRWVRDDAQVEPRSVRELPVGRTVLICDDAHRRPDLSAVLHLVNRPTPPRIVLGTRPPGRAAVLSAAHRAGIPPEDVCDLGDLPEIEKEHLIALLREELGVDIVGFAEPLADLIPDSPLVALVAAGLLRDKELSLGVLERDPEFRYTVLSRFREEQLGQIAAEIDPGNARRLLRVLSALGPLPLTDSGLTDAVASHLGLNPSEVRYYIGHLESAGIARSYRESVRIVPDVLGDSILHEAMIDKQGRPTGFDRDLIVAMEGQSIPYLLRNLAELDWRMTEVGETVDVFGHAWQEFLQMFSDAEGYAQGQLLEKLVPVAVFQPRRVLGFVRDLLERDFDAELDEWDAQWHLRPLDHVPQLLGQIAHHQEHAGEAFDLLWRIGRDDARNPDQNPGHAMRVLAQSAGYYPRRRIWTQRIALAGLRKWTSEPGWCNHVHSPIPVASALLAKVVQRNEWKEDSVVMSAVPIRPDVTMDIRLEVIELLGSLALGSEPKGRMQATKALADALAPPDAMFARLVTDEEDASWNEQYKAVVTQLKQVVSSGNDPLVHIHIKDRLPWLAQSPRPAIVRTGASGLRRIIKETAQVRLARAYGHSFPDGPGDRNWEEAVERNSALVTKTVYSLGTSDDSGESIFDELQVARCWHENAGVENWPEELLGALTELRSDVGVSVACRVICDDRENASWLHPILAKLADFQPDAYELLIGAASTSSEPAVRGEAVSAVLGLPWTRKLQDFEVEMLRALAQDDDPHVRRLVCIAIARFKQLEPATLSELVCSVDLDRSDDVAKALAGVWTFRTGDELPMLSNDEVRKLLARFAGVPSISGAVYEIDEVLARLGETAAVEVFEFLLERARREGAYRNRGEGEDVPRYDAVPYRGLTRVWSVLRKSKEITMIREKLRSELGANDTLRQQAIRDTFEPLLAGTDDAQ